MIYGIGIRLKYSVSCYSVRRCDAVLPEAKFLKTGMNSLAFVGRAEFGKNGQENIMDVVNRSQCRETGLGTIIASTGLLVVPNVQCCFQIPISFSLTLYSPHGSQSVYARRRFTC